MDIGLQYSSGEPKRHQKEMLPIIRSLLGNLPIGSTILDAGCGNGYYSGIFARQGYEVTGIDISSQGIQICREKYPDSTFHCVSICSPTITDQLGVEYDAILAIEVIEHIVSPVSFLSNCRRLLSKHGFLILSTPYHGYLKNLAIALLNRTDRHWNPLSEGGHIKFWSRKTIMKALRWNGFEVVDFKGYGRIPYLWKSMILKVQKSRADLDSDQ